MKRRKIFGMLAMSALLGLSLAACKDKDKDITEDPSGVVDNSGFVDIDMYTTSNEGKQLSTIIADTSGAKTVYFVGDKFTSEGLVIKGNYVSYVDGKPQGSQETITNYYLDTSEIDLNVIGTYPVKVIHRTGAVLKETTYDITVQSSEFDSLGIEYLAGIVPDQSIYTMVLGEEYIAPNPTWTAHYLKSGEETESTRELTAEESYSIIPDSSAVDLTKKGTYMIKYTMNASVKLPSGTTKKYKVQSYVLINIENPIVNLEFKSGKTSYETTIDDLDYSDWIITTTRINGAVEDVNYSPDLFKVTGLNKYAVGAATATITSVEEPTVSCTKEITMTESTTRNIILGNDFSNSQFISQGPSVSKGNETAALDYKNDQSLAAIKHLNQTYVLGTTGMVKAVNPSAIYCDRYNYGNPSAGEQPYYKDSYDGLAFPVRLSFVAASYLEITVEKAGDIIVFCAASGDGDPRATNLCDNEGNIIAESSDSGVKQEIVGCKFTVTEAGTYRITRPKGGYVHGVVFSLDK